NGLAPAADLLRKLGWEPVALTLPVHLTEQRDGENCLLILVEPEEAVAVPGLTADLSDAEVRGLLRWIELGNTLLLCSRHTTALHGTLNLVVTHDERADAREEIDVALGEAGG